MQRTLNIKQGFLNIDSLQDMEQMKSILNDAGYTHIQDRVRLLTIDEYLLFLYRESLIDRVKDSELPGEFTDAYGSQNMYQRFRDTCQDDVDF